MRLPLSSPALFHPPQLLAGDASDVVVDPLDGGSAQGFELGGGHAATFAEIAPALLFVTR